MTFLGVNGHGCNWCRKSILISSKNCKPNERSFASKTALRSEDHDDIAVLGLKEINDQTHSAWSELTAFPATGWVRPSWLRGLTTPRARGESGGRCWSGPGPWEGRTPRGVWKGIKTLSCESCKLFRSKSAINWDPRTLGFSTYKKLVLDSTVRKQFHTSKTLFL